MFRMMLAAYTAAMLAAHLFGRWLIPGMLAHPRRFWSARCRLRLELGYYLLLAGFWARHPAGFPLWPVAVLGTVHLAAWVAAGHSPAMSAGMAWTPRLARLLDRISIFDLARL